MKILTATVVAVAAVATVHAQDYTGACNELSNAYYNSTFFPNTTSYASLNVYSANNTIETPYCIFTPRTASAAAAAIRTFTAHRTVFAIRSGGHSYNAGFSSTSSGVLLDLLYLNSISYSAGNNTVKIGTGNTWGTVYRYLEKYNVTVPGGRASSVGVGGFSLGGGLSFYLYELGFSANSVVEYEVVTADGDVIVVDAEQYSDLFVALKGSGAPFALVTAFTYRAVQQGKIWGGQIYGGNSTVETALRAVARFMAPGGGMEDLNSHLISTVALVQSADAVVSAVGAHLLFYRIPVEETPLAFQDFVESAETELLYNTLRGNITVADLADEIAAGVVGARQITVPWTAISPDAQTLQALYAIFYEVWAPLMSQMEGVVPVLNMIPLGYGQGKNVNVLGLEPGLNYLVMSIFVGWTKEADDDIVREALKEVLTRSMEYLDMRQKLGRWIYMNYAWEQQDPIASYGEENVELLRCVQHTYDPTRVWEQLVKGGFKIPSN